MAAPNAHAWANTVDSAGRMARCDPSTAGHVPTACCDMMSRSGVAGGAVSVVGDQRLLLHPEELGGHSQRLRRRDFGLA